MAIYPANCLTRDSPDINPTPIAQLPKFAYNSGLLIRLSDSTQTSPIELQGAFYLNQNRRLILRCRINMKTSDQNGMVRSTTSLVSAGHYLATQAGVHVLRYGGNAIDAAAAMCFVMNVVEPHMNGIGGEVPVLIYSAKDKKVFAISGQGCAPRGLTINLFKNERLDLIPGDGYLPACVPAVVGTWAEAVARWGKLSFAEILKPAIEIAENGFPMYQRLRMAITGNAKKFLERYPTTAEIYCPNGKVAENGESIRNPCLAETLRALCKGEEEGRRRSRIHGIESARDGFYQERVAEGILRFIETPVEDASGGEHSGVLDYDDFAEWQAEVEAPVCLDYRELTVWKCPPWTQGPVFLQQLAILRGIDLRAMSHNSPEYIHTLIETAKLAFADREAYYGDPKFDEVPLEYLLSKEYAEKRRSLIRKTASREMRPGDVSGGVPDWATSFSVADNNRRALAVSATEAKNLGWGHGYKGDTVYICSADAEGNMVSAVPSGGWIQTSPVIAGLGFPLGTRAQMFYLNPARPNALAPRKRPRTTLTPTLVTRNGDPFMEFGTPGGDSQDQWTLQFFLNTVEFGMDLAEAIDAPTFHSVHFPSSFYPREAYPGRLSAEGRIPQAVLAELERRGHEVEVVSDWAHGQVQAIMRDSDGNLSGYCSRRRETGLALGL